MEKARPKAPALCKGIFVLALVMLYMPLVYLFVGSFVEKTPEGLSSFTLRWYQEIFNDHILLEAIGRSVLIATGNGLIATTLGAAAAIALLKSGFRFKKFLQGLSLVSLVMPELIFALSLLSWFFILKVQLSTMTVLAAHVTFSLSFVIFTVSARLASLDFSIEEAAQDLGASDWTILKRVVLPQLKPALTTAFILTFLLSFDDFLITFFTSGVGSDTLPIKLYASMKMGHTPKLNAMSSLMMILTAIGSWFLVRSKSFIE